MCSCTTRRLQHCVAVPRGDDRGGGHKCKQNGFFSDLRARDETLIRVLGDGIVDDAKRQQVVDAIVSAPTRADVEARKHKLGVIL